MRRAFQISPLLSALSTCCVIGIASISGCGESETITAQTSKYQVADEPTKPSPPAIANPASDSSVTETGGGIARTPPPAETSATANKPVDSQPGTAGEGQVDPSTTPADTSSPSASAAPPKPSSAPSGGVAKGKTTADPLLEKIRDLENQDPRGATREESIANLQRLQKEISMTADQAMAVSKDVPTIVAAAEAKTRALSILSQLSRESNEELQLFAVELAKSDIPELALLGRRMAFARHMDSFSQGTTKDAAKLMKEFTALFQEEAKDEKLFMFAQQVSQIFSQTGKQQEAIAVLQLIPEAFKDTKNEQLAAAVDSIVEQLAMAELSINEKLTALMEDRPNAETEFLGVVDKMLAAKKLGGATLQLIQQLAQVLEDQKPSVGAMVYAKSAAAFAKTATPELAAAAKKMSESFTKRNAIVGKPFTVEGVTIDGKPFDWNLFKGKVVLVDFWATWCGPCLKEIPNIKQNLEKYHEQGFEVVGVNLDDEPGALQQFFSRQKLPWPTVLSNDPSKAGFENPLAVKCGVEAIPFLVLVGRDGKAIALNPRGEELGVKLAELFPSASAPPNPPSVEKKSGG